MKTKKIEKRDFDDFLKKISETTLSFREVKFALGVEGDKQSDLS